MWGMSRKEWEDEQEDIMLWPGNESAYRLWCRIGNQWRMSMGGPEALDYGPLFHELDRMGLAPDEYEVLFSDIRVMESSALDAIREHASKE